MLGGQSAFFVVRLRCCWRCSAREAHLPDSTVSMIEEEDCPSPHVQIYCKRHFVFGTTKAVQPLVFGSYILSNAPTGYQPPMRTTTASLPCLQRRTGSLALTRSQPQEVLQRKNLHMRPDAQLLVWSPKFLVRTDRSSREEHSARYSSEHKLFYQRQWRKRLQECLHCVMHQILMFLQLLDRRESVSSSPGLVTASEQAASRLSRCAPWLFTPCLSMASESPGRL